jgi:hypothetical protein
MPRPCWLALMRNAGVILVVLLLAGNAGVIHDCDYGLGADGSVQ